jgi:D-arginine dehydrogenase
VDVDVAVIGGGIAGAAAAWAIAPDAGVAVLEAESAVGFHSTGRSAAILTESYESGLVRALTARTRRILGEEFGELTGVLSDRGVLWVAARGEQAAPEAAAGTAGRGPAQVRRVDAGEARRLCPALRAGACAGARYLSRRRRPSTSTCCIRRCSGGRGLMAAPCCLAPGSTPWNGSPQGG